MKKNSTLWGLSLCLVLATTTGCDDKPATSAPASAPASAAAYDQTTPVGAVGKMASAMMTGDKKSFMETMAVGDKLRPAVEAMFDMTSSMLGLKTAVVAAYGEEGWQKMGQSSRGPTSVEQLQKQMDQTTATTKGDTATVLTPDGQKIALVRRGGLWMINAEDMPGLTSEQEIRQATMMLKAMADSMREATKKVGQEGVTPETLAQDMNTAMMVAMMSQTMADAASEPATQPAPTTVPAE
jgi:hypothetical protein